MFCQNCGKEMNDGASFCSNCGWKNSSTKGITSKLKDSINGFTKNLKPFINNVKHFISKIKAKFLELELKKRVILVAGIVIVISLFIIIKNNVFSRNDNLSNLSSFISKSKKTGWVEENGEKYFYDDSGNKVVSNWKNVGGSWYYFDIDGKCVINDWRKIDDAYYYFNEEGIMQKDKWIENKYYVNSMGYMLTNTLTPDGYYVNKNGERDEKICFTTRELLNHYNNAKALSESTTENSFYYPAFNFGTDFLESIGFDADGNLWISGHDGLGVSHGSYVYIKVSKNGRIDNYSAWSYVDDLSYEEPQSYFGYSINKQDVTGEVFNNSLSKTGYTPIVLEDLNLKGWYLIGDYYYYFGDGGRMYKNQWVDGKHYVDVNGHMLTNAMTPDGYWVNSKGDFVENLNDVVIYTNGYFYMNGNILKNRWVVYDNNNYYLDANGMIEKNKWIDGKYVGSNGVMYVGAITPDGKYVGSDGSVVNDIDKDLKDSIKEKNVEGEAWYKTKAGLWYYFEKDRKTLRKGWFNDNRDNQTYYLDKNTGIMAVGWTEIDGNWYYFNESYENEPNWYEVGDGIYESFGKKVKSYGSMYKNEITPDGKKVDENGKLIGDFVSSNILNVNTNANGDIIKFGNYMITNNGNKDAIEWIVLDKQNDKTLLLSKYIIDCKCYNEIRDKVTWETCTLRKWLNNDFYNTAFNNDEKNKIVATTLNQMNNPNNDKSKGGNATNDKVFLLSIDEIRKYFNQQGLTPDNQKLAALPTEYAKSKDNSGEKLWINNDNSVWHNGYGYFWLRSPGVYQRDAAGVDSNGGLDIDGRYVDVKVIGVRPALWVLSD